MISCFYSCSEPTVVFPHAPSPNVPPTRQHYQASVQHHQVHLGAFRDHGGQLHQVDERRVQGVHRHLHRAAHRALHADPRGQKGWTGLPPDFWRHFHVLNESFASTLVWLTEVFSDKLLLSHFTRAMCHPERASTSTTRRPWGSTCPDRPVWMACLATMTRPQAPPGSADGGEATAWRARTLRGPETACPGRSGEGVTLYHLMVYHHMGSYHHNSQLCLFTFT